MSVSKYYSELKVKPVALWGKILTCKRKEFPNISFLVEIVLCLGPSNAFVEAGFSILTSMLSDRRMNLNHKTMEDLLLLITLCGLNLKRKLVGLSVTM